MDILEIKKEILGNLDFEAIKIEKINRNYSVLLQDKKSKLTFWFDFWEYGDELHGDWNQYIFDLSNSSDLLKKEIQEDSSAYELAYSVAQEAILRMEE